MAVKFQKFSIKFVQKIAQHRLPHSFACTNVRNFCLDHVEKEMVEILYTGGINHVQLHADISPSNRAQSRLRSSSLVRLRTKKQDVFSTPLHMVEKMAQCCIWQLVMYTPDEELSLLLFRPICMYVYHHHHYQ